MMRIICHNKLYMNYDICSFFNGPNFNSAPCEQGHAYVEAPQCELCNVHLALIVTKHVRLYGKCNILSCQDKKKKLF